MAADPEREARVVRLNALLADIVRVGCLKVKRTDVIPVYGHAVLSWFVVGRVSSTLRRMCAAEKS
jgi:hypothetical protein